MKWSNWGTALPLVVAAFGFAGCGDTKDRFGPDVNFTIKEELANQTFIYNFTEGEVRIRYFADVDSVVGVSVSSDNAFCVGIVGTPIGADKFQILGAAADSNNNGNFLDETLVPVTRDSTGTFESNADKLLIDMEAVVAGVPIHFGDRGDFVRTEEPNPHC
ncbi:MAG: hypothetical protein IPK07_25915 [Deltaproteobacteria bacterium]|jgi:hypothetical protein|nr:hypothetical protein [Deltaproteobacteria bacterium]